MNLKKKACAGDTCIKMLLIIDSDALIFGFTYFIFQFVSFPKIFVIYFSCYTDPMYITALFSFYVCTALCSTVLNVHYE